MTASSSSSWNRRCLELSACTHADTDNRVYQGPGPGPRSAQALVYPGPVPGCTRVFLGVPGARGQQGKHNSCAPSPSRN